MKSCGLNLRLPVALVSALAMAEAGAQTSWLPFPADGSWQNPANWDFGDVPDTNVEQVIFGASAISTVGLSAPVAVKKVTFAADSGDYTLSGSPLTVDLADPGTAVLEAVALQAGFGTVTLSNLLNLNDAGGGNNSQPVINVGDGRRIVLAGGASSAAGNRNLQVIGNGPADFLTSLTTGTGQLQHSGNATINLFVNPLATQQMRSFSNGGGGIRIHANNTRPIGLGVTGSVTHVGRVFLAANGVTTSGAITTTGATVAGTHRMDVTFGADIPGAGVAAHSGTMAFGALTGSAAGNGSEAFIRLFAGEQDVLTMSGVVSGYPTGYANPVLRKEGLGTVEMTAANTHTVPMEVAEGTLTVTTLPLGGGAVTVADGAVFGVRVASAGTTLLVSDLTMGSATGGTLQLETGLTGNPLAPVVSAGNFNVQAPTVVKVSGKLGVTAAPVPLIGYSSLGGLGAGALSLALPFRVQGSLVNQPALGVVGLNITSAGGIVWRGNVNGTWDADASGTGQQGTANWTAASGPGTYVEGLAGTDSVTFDDSAGGTTTVQLVGPLSPVSVTVDNSVKDYRWTGLGHLAGASGIVKSGTGTLTLAHSGQSTNAGASFVNGGRLVIGDGATAGVGSLAGPVTVAAGAVLEANRPDGVVLRSLAGDGSLRLSSPATVSAGGIFGGVISGAGALTSAGGNLQLTGSEANANSGPTTVSGGQLQLAKLAGVNAIGGDLVITGGATLALQSPEQIPDTAQVIFTGTSADSLPVQTASETIGGVLVQPPVATGQFIMRQNMVVNGLADVRSGIFAVASGHSATAREIALSAGAIVRIAGSSGPSVLYVGPGGIRAAGGDIQVKFNTGAQDATLDLSGDFMATGDVTISNAGYGGANLNVVLLNGERTFRMAEGTTTTVAADVSGSGSLLKAGLGTLSLLGSCAADPAGGTEVNEGALTVRGQLGGGAVTVKGSGVLGGDGNVVSDVTVQSGGRVAPRTGLVGSADPAVLNFGAGLTLAAGSRYVAEITGPGANDRLAVSGPLVTSGTVAVVLSGYVPVAGDVFDLVDATLRSGVPSFDFSGAGLGAGLAWDTSLFATEGVVRVVEGGGSVFDSWAAGYGLSGADAAAGADPDRDGVPNVMEFAVGSHPVRGGSVPQSFARVHELAGGRVLTFTVPVRAGAVFAASGARQTAVRDGVTYVVEASDDLVVWNAVVVTKLGAADSAAVQGQLSLPGLEAGWEWATFRTDGVAGTDPADFVRLRVQ